MSIECCAKLLLCEKGELRDPSYYKQGKTLSDRWRTVAMVTMGLAVLALCAVLTIGTLGLLGDCNDSDRLFFSYHYSNPDSSVLPLNFDI